MKRDAIARQHHKRRLRESNRMARKTMGELHQRMNDLRALFGAPETPGPTLQ